MKFEFEQVEWTITNLNSTMNATVIIKHGTSWQNLTLHNIQGEDTGSNMTCTAENIVGKVSKHIRLLVNSMSR